MQILAKKQVFEFAPKRWLSVLFPPKNIFSVTKTCFYIQVAAFGMCGTQGLVKIDSISSIRYQALAKYYGPKTL